MTFVDPLFKFLTSLGRHTEGVSLVEKKEGFARHDKDANNPALEQAIEVAPPGQRARQRQNVDWRFSASGSRNAGQQKRKNQSEAAHNFTLSHSREQAGQLFSVLLACIAPLLMPEAKRTQGKLTPLHHDDKPCSFLANFVDRKKRFRTAGFCFDGEANAKYDCTATKDGLAAVGQPIENSLPRGCALGSCLPNSNMG
jgi:hypothetical protein